MVLDPANQTHLGLLPAIVSIHAACITTDFTLATFLPPLDHSVMLKWWEDRVAECASGRRCIVVQLVERSKGEPPNFAAASPVGPDVAGVVSLAMPYTQTGPFRGLVEKLLVSLDHRQRGVAKGLIRKLEEVARQEGRTSLLLDTEHGSLAEAVYLKFGYTKLGTVEKYGYSPKDLGLVDETFFWKDLNDSASL